MDFYKGSSSFKWTKVALVVDGIPQVLCQLLLVNEINKKQWFNLEKSEQTLWGEQEAFLSARRYQTGRCLWK